MTAAEDSLAFWLDYLADREIPVLRQTARGLTDLRAHIDEVTPRSIANVVLRDPMMTARVLRFALRHRSRRQLQEISTVEHAVMMFGVEPFFHHFSTFDVVEDRLEAHPQALLGLLQVIKRAQRAARYALEWATWRADLNAEEVAVATILHDLSEVMMWCFAPEQILQIKEMREQNPGMRSVIAQKSILGFSLNELQTALCKKWEMPELLSSLMDDAHQDKPRVRNVKLAIDLARHSANGWDNPALIEDLNGIAKLLNIDYDTLLMRMGLQGRSVGSGPA